MMDLKSRCPELGAQRFEISDMEVKDPLPAFLDARLHAWFFDIHVEGVKQQSEVLHAEALDQVQPLGDIVDQRGLITVDRFQRQADPMREGCRAALSTERAPANPSPDRLPRPV